MLLFLCQLKVAIAGTSVHFMLGREGFYQQSRFVLLDIGNPGTEWSVGSCGIHYTKY